MPSAFPTALPNAKTDFDLNTLIASSFQNQQGLDINAIAAKVGINSSADTNSLDYKINNISTLVVATGAEVNTGTDNVKYVTPKAIVDSNVALVADIPVKATGAEANTGTNDAKFLTPLAYDTARTTVTAYTPAGAGTTTIDLSKGNIFRVTMPAATQTLAISNATTGQEFVVEIVNVSSQGALTWFSTITWARDGAAPALTGVNTKVDTFRFRVTGAGTYLGYDDDTYVKRTATQTLTNKTLTSPVINTPTGDVATLTGTQTLTNKTIGTTNLISFNAPEGFLINGKIVPSVASNNLTVAIKGLDGNNPSATSPVYIRIGDTIRSITGALSVTKNAGTNWCNSGSTELATIEVDYFVYIGYNATDGVVIGFSRIPSASIYSDFSATSTNEKYAGISTITNAAAGDNYIVIGRFAATLSAGAGYTWTVPTFTTKNLIQRPIYESRWATYLPTYSADSGTWTSVSGGIIRYRIAGNTVNVRVSVLGTTSASPTYIGITTPFVPAYPANEQEVFHAIYRNGGAYAVSPQSFYQTDKLNVVGTFTNGTSRGIAIQGSYEI
jgi:hypothetical protein